MRKISFFILCLFCFVLVGCASNETKEVGTISNFNTIAINNGFEFYDNMDTYVNDTYIKDSKQAKIDGITIEMIIYDTEDNAKKGQDHIIDNFLTIKGTGVTADKEKGKNFYKFTMVSNGYYMVCSRIDNTLIFSKTLLENREKVEKILTDMNY